MLVEEAARKIGQADLRRLAEIYESMNQAGAGDLRRYLAANQEFHFAIYRAAQLPNALRMVENLWLQVGPLLNFLLSDSGAASSPYFSQRDRVYQKHHRATLEALRRGDRAAARRGIADDINEAADFLLATAHFAVPAPVTAVDGAHPRSTMRSSAGLVR
jgi:DNA-binding GntR family transcriptional regulator